MEEYTQKEIIEATEIHPTLWIEQNNICNETGIPLEFKHRRFLIDIYNDFSPLIAILKPPQIGATVMNTIKSLFAAKKLGKQIIYTLPTSGDVGEMVGGSVNRIIAQNPILMSWVKDHDTIEQKSVGSSMIFYRGTFTQKQAMMIPSDLNIHDEVDASNPSVVETYETRLQAKSNGWRWYFSHPSAEDFGVDKYWKQSDQKHWFITCPHCKVEHYLEWPKSIDASRKCFICKECGGVLRDEDRENGRWLPKYSKEWQELNGVKPFSGYWISQLMCSWISAEKILKDYQEKSQEYFYNYVLGLPYSGGGAKLGKQSLFQNLTGKLDSALQDERVLIGVDTGFNIDYVIGNKRLGLFYHGDTKNYQDLDALMRRWPKAIVIMDAGGDMVSSAMANRPSCKEFAERWPNRVFLCYFTGQKMGKLVDWGEGDKWGQVSVDREQIIQMVVDEFRGHRIPLQGTESDWYEYWQDWNNLSRITIFDPKTNVSRGVKWVRNGRDHRALATCLWRVGMDRFAESEAQFIMPQSDFAQRGFEG